MKTVGLGLWSLAASIAIGAFGAHALKTRVPDDLLEIFKTGQTYQVYASLAVVALGLASSAFDRNVKVPVWLVCAGGAVFSGSLYLLALTGVRLWGAVTPIGGVLMITGTVWAATAFSKGQK